MPYIFYATLDLYPFPEYSQFSQSSFAEIVFNYFLRFYAHNPPLFFLDSFLYTVLWIKMDADKYNSITILCPSLITYSARYREISFPAFPPHLQSCIIMKSQASQLSYLGVPRKQALTTARITWGITFNVSWLKQWPMLPRTHTGSGSSGLVPHKPARMFSILCW